MRKQAEERWKKGETIAQLESVGDGYRLHLNSYLIAQGQVVALAASQAFLVAQARVNGAPEPERIPMVVESPGHAHATNYAAFLVPGLVGLNLLSTGLFAVGMVTVAYREKGKYRRLAVTPLPKWVFLGGPDPAARDVGAPADGAAAARGVARLPHHEPGLVPRSSPRLVVFGTATFIAMGFALSSFASTVETYGAVSNLAFFPMMLLSGVYFRLDSAPQWLQKAVLILPLSPFLRALRAVYNDGATLPGHAAGLAILAAWAALSFVVRGEAVPVGVRLSRNGISCTVFKYKYAMATETTYTNARANLKALLDEAADTREPVIIHRRGGDDVALIAADELRSLIETAHLLRSPANAERLLRA